MIGFRALRLAAMDVWEDSLTLLAMAFLGSAAAVLILPLPFVLAGHYGIAARLPEDRVIGLRLWLAAAREHASFFVRWALLLGGTTLACLTSIRFYSRMETEMGQLLGGIVVMLLVLWWLPQPYVPALYLRQSDRRLRVALRNAVVLAARDPLAILLLWGSVLLLAFPLGYVAWPLLFILTIWVPLVATRIVWLQLKREYRAPAD